MDLRGFDARSIDSGPISWLARNTTKPGREGLDSWTVHASADWSTAHLEATPDQVLAPLLDAFRDVTGTGAVEPVYQAAHRWRYALVTTTVGRPALYDRSSGLGLCGDWCLGGKIEAAFLSGRALAELMRS
jgi:renalase